VTPVPLPREALTLPRHWRIGPAARPVTDESHLHRRVAFAGVGLRPFSPARLRARRDHATGDVAVTWLRRTRIGGDSWAAVEVPLGEEREAYRLRVLSGGAPVREAALAAPAFIYTAAQQAADGVAGPLEFRVAQLSLTYGYGPERGIVFDG
jgi:hypothetical protein